METTHWNLMRRVPKLLTLHVEPKEVWLLWRTQARYLPAMAVGYPRPFRQQRIRACGNTRLVPGSNCAYQAWIPSNAWQHGNHISHDDSVALVRAVLKKTKTGPWRRRK